MSKEIIRLRNRFYIISTSSRIDDRVKVLKSGDTFAVFDRFGDIDTIGSGDLGIYHRDTRFFSRLILRLKESRPLLLSSHVDDDNGILWVDLMNPDIYTGNGTWIPRGTVHLSRAKVIWNGACCEKLVLHNYGDVPVQLPLSLDLGADFADIFEVRGVERKRRGHPVSLEAQSNRIVFSYEGLDGLLRRSEVTFEPLPEDLSPEEVTYRVNLGPREGKAFFWAFNFEVGQKAAITSSGERHPERSEVSKSFLVLAGKAKARVSSLKEKEPSIFTDNEQFNDWINRSLIDLRMMQTETPWGSYPYAGVPWYSTVFGRDGIITALECLWFNPEIARGVLACLAATQGEAEEPESECQQGKILHEMRNGEMANTGEIPFKRYYGTVDATPLFVLLSGKYFERTGDRDFAFFIWPHVERALSWIKSSGDVDGDRFVEYDSKAAQGLVNQGWKDSHDSVFHQDGSDVKPPIALCEVQGYVYAAKVTAAAMAMSLGMHERAFELRTEADTLRREFEHVFWDEGLGTYGLALDGDKRLCKVRASNAGHCLYTGIVDPGRARILAAGLMGSPFFSGWGIRTLADTESRYNPMSYHNGSVWPHDNALIAEGLSRYGFKNETLRIITGLFDASLFFDLHRLPELFCGFRRHIGAGPTLYPVSCSPQSWASGAAFLLLKACLGLDIKAAKGKVVFSNPILPEYLQEVKITGLSVGDGSIDLLLRRYGKDVTVNVLGRKGQIVLELIK